MRWILDNIQVLIAIAGLIAYWVNQYYRHKQGAAGEGKDENPEPTYDPSEMEAEEAERTRRIMEEMRRKRAERSGGAQQPPLHQPARPEPTAAPAAPVPPVRPLAAPPPVYRDPMSEMMKELAKRLQPQVASEPEIDQQALARQRELEDKLQALEREKRETEARAKALSAAAVYAAAPAHEASADEDWLSALRNPSGARKAILYSEVFGKPVSLR